MSKQVFIIHGWGGSPDTDWHPWLKQELERKGFKVEVPAMPDSFNPKIHSWVSTLKKAVGKSDKDTYFIGHSIGCQTILRYVEKLNQSEKVGGVIFVAGWLHLTVDTWDENYTEEIAAPWLNTPIDFNKIKEHATQMVDFYSENDPYVPVTDSILFKEKLDAKSISVGNKGHVSGEDRVKEVPFVVEELMRMVKIY
ncbi:alpha/beta hydrolase [Candidatus Woesearchaeota archaeon]|nr:alpha/beta hydrolase [Candidatus Woesearchaeota archaeon]